MVEKQLNQEKIICPQGDYDLLKIYQNQAYYRKFCGDEETIHPKVLAIRLVQEKSGWKITQWDKVF
ncbi:MAG: hypothetical protein KDK66_05625 [Deltaproteobacteria bacterium]|nr:hypothetical protein [Deltaproteobacteria bacterium]